MLSYIINDISIVEYGKKRRKIALNAFKTIFAVKILIGILSHFH